MTRLHLAALRMLRTGPFADDLAFGRFGMRRRTVRPAGTASPAWTRTQAARRWGVAGLLLALGLMAPTARACGSSHLGLSGVVHLTTCDPQSSQDCVNAAGAVYEYMEAVPDPDTVYTVGLPSSPWRMYDGEMRIITVEDMAELVRPKLDTVESVELIGSWTGVSPEPGLPSLAERVSRALGGIPVRGEDGFLWLAADGSRRTTRQAFTTREGAGSYFVPRGAEVFVPLATGWPAFVEHLIPEDDTVLLLHAAVGWDVFFLCPDRALAGFERAAAQGSAVAAYNAALMRLERNGEGDRAAALALLERAAALGDGKSRARLEATRSPE